MAKIRVDGLEMYVQECLREAVDKAAEDACDYLTVYIMKHFYNTYSPTMYERTFDFIKSVSKTDARVIRGTVSCLIYFDTEKIRPKYYGPWLPNPHMSFYGETVSESIPRWIELGNKYIIGRSGRPLGSMEATARMLEKNFHNMVAKYLRKQGLNIEVK